MVKDPMKKKNSEVAERPPQIKITNIRSEHTDMQLIELLKEQNAWFRDSEFTNSEEIICNTPFNIHREDRYESINRRCCILICYIRLCAFAISIRIPVTLTAGSSQLHRQCVPT